MKRNETKQLKIGNVAIGGQNKVIIQSMCNIKTENIDLVVAQINKCAELGADMMRVSIMDELDADAIKEIKKHISIPLIADIHFDYRLAILAIENGADKIRINPGNIGSKENVKKVVEAAKKHHCVIRVGVNSGSLDKTIHDYSSHYTYKNLVESAKKHVAMLEEFDFHDIVISLKGSDVLETIDAYRLASKIFPYPLHLGITEAGPNEIGIIRSVAGLAPLLHDGIGDTIRISLTGDPYQEVIACKRLLHDLKLYPNYPTIVACPTCGRTSVDVLKKSDELLHYLESVKKPITVAIMGCIVNGPGEAKNADYGIAGANGKWAIFKKGQVIKTVDEENVINELISLLK